MKVIARNASPASTTPALPVIAPGHSNYRSPANQAAAALRNLVIQFKLKKTHTSLPKGRA